MLALLLTPALWCSSEASSLHVGELCRGGSCPDPRYPLLDYDKEQGTCICRAHPCWNNEGVAHNCPGTDYPFLHFTYGADGSLSCTCSSLPQYDSVHVSRDLCAGEFCDSEEFPVLDWDKAEGKCLCRRHPCKDPNVVTDAGARATCEDPARPVLHYRQDQAADGSGQAACECGAKLEPPAVGLRGAKSRETASCVWGSSSRRW